MARSPGLPALLPLSVDGMIIAASLTLLADSRHGRRSGALPWTLLVIASGASLAANVASAPPTVVSRVIAAWPPFALISAYEMLMRQIRNSVAIEREQRIEVGVGATAPSLRDVSAPAGPVDKVAENESAPRTLAAATAGRTRRPAAERRQRQAWQWALTHRESSGELPSGEAIADAFQRSPRWVASSRTLVCAVTSTVCQISVRHSESQGLDTCRSTWRILRYYLVPGEFPCHRPRPSAGLFVLIRSSLVPPGSAQL